MEEQLYHLSLLLAGILNLIMAGALLYGNYYFRYYEIYHRSRLLTALCFAVFGVGFLTHYYYGWRFCWPEAATALSVTYFHLGGMMLSWSHTSLLNPEYLDHYTAIQDLVAAFVCLTFVWTGAIQGSELFLNVGIGIFVLHVAWMSAEFLLTYHRVRHRLLEIRLGNITGFVRWMLLSCYLIIGFGLGSVIFTAFLPTAVWPYTVLLCVGMAVFTYIFYSISEYGTVIDSTTNATEDVAMKDNTKSKRKKSILWNK